MNIYSQLINLGASDISNAEERKVRVINKFNLLCLGFGVGLAIINASSGLWYQAFANFVGIALINIPVFLFNYQRRYELAKWIFSIGLISLVMAVSIANAINHRSTSTEILILAFGSFVIIVFEGKGKNVLFLICALSIYIIEYYKDLYLWDGGFTASYFFSLLNYSIALIAVYFFSQIFKSELDRAVSKVEQLNSDLEHSRMVLYSLIDDTPMFLAMMDADGKYVMVNKKFENAFDMPRSQMIGKHYKEVLSAELVSFHEPLINRSFGGEYLDFYEERITTPGIYDHSYGKYFPVFDDNGQVRYIIVFVTDISDLKKAENKLQDLNRAKDKMFSVLAHDIISPINLLKNAISLNEQQDELGPVDLNIFLSRTKEQLLTLTHMMENLLRWGKSQFHGWKSTPEMLSVSKIVSDLLEVYGDHSRSKNLEVKCQLSDSKELFADKGHLELVLRNLMVNAFKFSESGSIVEIFEKEAPNELEIHIVDQGVGLSEDLIDIISKGGVVESEMGTAGESGTGLGLQLCFEVVKVEGWKLTAVGGSKKGAHFVLSIPYQTK